MIIMTLRTDKPEAEIGLYDGEHKVLHETWQAHRELAETIHLKINAVLRARHLLLQELQGIVVFQGPGSFTGLRIGLTVANALASSLGIPIVGVQTEDWITDGIRSILSGEDDKLALPEYGALPNVSTPKK